MAGGTKEMSGRREVQPGGIRVCLANDGKGS